MTHRKKKKKSTRTEFNWCTIQQLSCRYNITSKWYSAESVYRKDSFVSSRLVSSFCLVSAKKKDILLPPSPSPPTDRSFSPSPFNTTPPPRLLSDICRPTAGSLRLRRVNKMTHYQLIQLIDMVLRRCVRNGYNCIALHGCKCGTCVSSIGVIGILVYVSRSESERVKKKGQQQTEYFWPPPEKPQRHKCWNSSNRPSHDPDKDTVQIQE